MRRRRRGLRRQPQEGTEGMKQELVLAMMGLILAQLLALMKLLLRQLLRDVSNASK